MPANRLAVVKADERRERGKQTSGMIREEAFAGDFLRVPPGVVHRESNPSSEEGQLIVVRYGGGPPTVNVDGPEA